MRVVTLRQLGWRLAAVVTVAVAVVAAGLPQNTLAAFKGETVNAANTWEAKPDWTKPTLTASRAVLSSGKAAGTIRPGATYHVYANATDGGTPPSGVASISGDVSLLTTGQTAASLAAGTFSAGGTAYSWRSSALTAGAGLTDGTYSYALLATDAAGNQRTTSFPVTVDATPPSAADIQAENTSGGIQGRVEIGDRLIYTFSEPVDPTSILGGWDGTATTVILRGTVVGGGANAVADWTIRNSTDTAQLSLGVVHGGKHLAHNGGGITAPSTMVLSGSTLTVTITSISGGVHSNPAPGYDMVWDPSAAVADLVGHSATTTSRTEQGTSNDVDF